MSTCGFIGVTLSLCILGTMGLLLLFPPVTLGQAIGAGAGMWLLMISAKLIGSAEVN